MKMRSRLLITALVLLSFGFYWLVDWIVQDVRLHYFITMEESLVDTSVILSSMVAGQSDRGTVRVEETFGKALQSAAGRRFAAEIYDHTKTNMNLRIVVVDAGSIVVFDSRGAAPAGSEHHWRDTRLALAGKYGARATYEIPGDPDSFHFYVAAPVMAGHEIIGAVSVGKPVSSIAPFMKQARIRLVVSGLMAFAAIMLLLIPVSLWIIQPVRLLTRYAHDIRDGRKVARPRLGHGGEMSQLADAFEEMRDALEGKQYVEEYVQSFTHEMKSPLSAIQGAAELLGEEMPDSQRERFRANIRAESERLHGLVDRMLSLAALEKRKMLAHPEIIDLQVLLDDVTDSLLPVTQGKAIAVQVRVNGNTELPGEYFLLRQVVSNLLQNAIDFSDKGSVVEILAAAERDRMVITVRDRGCGLPEYAQDRVFERFYSLPRPDGASKSSGLGLNFVREIVELHGGEVRLSNRPGGGVEVRLSFPRTG